MARMMRIPVLGLVENYSYFQCPDCGKRHEIFGKSRLDEAAAAQGVACKDRVPVDPSLAAAVDAGTLEDASLPYLDNAVTMLQALKN